MPGENAAARVVTRIQAHGRFPRKLAEHIRAGAGDHRPGTARPVPAGEPAIEALRDFDAAAIDRAHRRHRYVLDERRRLRKAGRPPKPTFDLVIAGPPQYHAPDAWSFAREVAWAGDTADWLEQTFPGARWAAMSLHRDETSPHVQALCVHGAGLEKVLQQGLGTAYRGRRLLAEFQSAYARDVGQRYGLARGARRVEARHQAVSGVKALEARAEAAEKRVRDAEAQLGEMEERVRKAEARVEAALTREDKAYQRECGYVDVAREEAEKAETRRDTAQADATAAEERKTAAEAAVAAAKEEHEQLEAQYNTTRKALRALKGETVEAQATRDDLAAELVQLRQDSKAARERLVAAENAAVAAEDRRRQADLAREALETAADAAWARLVESDRIFTSPGGLASVFRLGTALGRDPGRRGEIDLALRKTGHSLREYEEGMTAGVKAPAPDRAPGSKEGPSR